MANIYTQLYIQFVFAVQNRASLANQNGKTNYTNTSRE